MTNARITEVIQNPDSVSVSFTRSDDGSLRRLALASDSTPEDITAAVADWVAQANASPPPNQFEALVGTTVT